jgi:hypothetical protein
MLYTEREDMSTTIGSETSAIIGTGNAELQYGPDSELSVFVVYTSFNWTLKALEKALEIARPLGANIVVVAAQVVPFPLPLDRPPVPMEFVIRCFEEKANELPDGTQISAYLCRNPMEALKRILSPHCPVVIGIKKRWWPTHDGRLARKLIRAGYNLTLVKAE